MIMPGVQKPHCSAWCSLNAACSGFRPVFGETPRQLHDVFGIDSGEALIRAVYRTLTWHAYDNDLLVTEAAAVVDYLRSFPPGETATPQQVEAMQRQAEGLMVDGVLRIRPRAGVFVASEPR